MYDIRVTNYRDAQFWLIAVKELKNEDVVREAKQALRKFFNRMPEEPEARIFDNDYDHFIKVFPLPDDITTPEEADEYFRECEYIHYRPTYYDCTGQWFTSWYKVFRKPDGRFWAYHSVQADV